MSAILETQSDVEVLEALDFDPNVACDARNGGCPRSAAARWFSVCRHCGDVLAFCDGCRAFCEQRAAVWLRLGLPVGCRRCRVVTTTTIEDLVRWVPVKGGA